MASRSAFVAAGICSFFINLLMLTAPLYMLQIYDRVLRGGSEAVLFTLTAMAAGLLLLMAVLDLIRAHILIQAGLQVDERLNTQVFSAVFDQTLQGGRGQRVQALRELDSLRHFLSGPGPSTCFDTPWVPLYLVVVFLFHPALGAVALVGAVALFGTALLNEMMTRRPLQSATMQAADAGGFAETTLRNAEVLQAMGMLPSIRKRWLERHARALEYQSLASKHGAALTSLSKFLRITLQVAMLCSGAWLALRHYISPGVVIAASIVMGRALSPVESLIGQWRQFVSARGAYRRLKELLDQQSPPRERTVGAVLHGDLLVEDLTGGAPGLSVPVLKNISFKLSAGESLGVIGYSASGKSTLARHLVGVWRPQSGAVLLGGNAVHQCNGENLGPYIGYLPQDVELLAGTIAENISRFADEPHNGAIEAAARRAGVHELIMRLEKAYDTQIGEQGRVLSGGQRQRIALARALYGEPVLVVLDEPNSSLDAAGDAALARAILGLKAQGTTVVVMAHRPSAIEAVDKLLLIRDGEVAEFGPKDSVLAKISRPPPRAQASALRSVS